MATNPDHILEGQPQRKIAPLSLPDIERTVSALGAKLAMARAERGWSLSELARRAGVSTASIHKIEKSGMTPTIASLMKIAAALGKSVAHFVDEPETPDVLVVRGDARARVYTSKQGLDLRNLSGRYGSTGSGNGIFNLNGVFGDPESGFSASNPAAVVTFNPTGFVYGNAGNGIWAEVANATIDSASFNQQGDRALQVRNHELVLDVRVGHLEPAPVGVPHDESPPGRVMLARG